MERSTGQEGDRAIVSGLYAVCIVRLVIYTGSIGGSMTKYKETKSRNSITKDFGGKVQVRVKIPANTCHRGESVEFHSLEKPPAWYCAKCGKVLLVETPVNEAFISDLER
jgi:hypothetical protein